VLHLLATWCGWFAKRLLILPKAANKYCCSAAAAAAVVLLLCSQGRRHMALHFWQGWGGGSRTAQESTASSRDARQKSSQKNPAPA
jgi:hypothetical protein